VKVHLVRHSRAVDESHGMSDDDRFLSADGRRRAREVGARLAKEGVTFDAVLSSPLARAVQTAELVCERVGFLGVIEVTRRLVHGVPPRLVAAELPGKGVSVACFGHMPTISELGAFLCGSPGFPGFQPCQVVCIEDGKPVWSLDPVALRIDRLVVQ
jgi:phosphohistidine phosphatase